MDADRVEKERGRPYIHEEAAESRETDPHKFKRVMKVEESDEAQKRHKRNLKRSEEEGDEEGEVEESAPPPPPETTFSNLMSDEKKAPSIYDKSSGGVRYQKAPSLESVPPPKVPIDTEGVDIDETHFPSLQSTEKSVPPMQQVGKASVEETKEAARQKESKQSELREKKEIKQNLQEESQSTAQKEKQKTEDISLLATQPKLDALKPKKRKKAAMPPPEVKILSNEELEILPKEKMEDAPSVASKERAIQEEDPSGIATHYDSNESDKHEVGEIESSLLDKGEEIKEGEGEGSKEGAVALPEEREALFRPFTPDEIRQQKLAVTAKEKASLATEHIEEVEEEMQQAAANSGGEQEEQHKGVAVLSFVEASRHTAGIPLPHSQAVLPPVAPSASTPPYAKLSPQLYELFEKMAGILIVQEGKGVSTTTMNIHLPNTIFDGAQIILDKYSTAPHSYNIQLVGSPEAVALFAGNLNQLNNSFKQGGYNFEVNLLTPAISEKKKSAKRVGRKRGT